MLHSKKEMNNAFGHIPEDLLQQAQDAWEFKTCQRSDGTTYGTAGDCAQKGAKEVKKSKSEKSSWDDSNLVGKMGAELSKTAGPGGGAKFGPGGFKILSKCKGSTMRDASGRCVAAPKGESDSNYSPEQLAERYWNMGLSNRGTPMTPFIAKYYAKKNNLPMPDKSKLNTKPSISDPSKLSAVDTSASARQVGFDQKTMDMLKRRMYDSRKKTFDKKEVARIAKIAEKEAKRIAKAEAKAARYAGTNIGADENPNVNAGRSRSARNVSTPQLDNYQSTGNLQADIQGLMGAFMGDLMGTDANTAMSIVRSNASSGNSGGGGSYNPVTGHTSQSSTRLWSVGGQTATSDMSWGQREQLLIDAGISPSSREGKVYMADS